MRLVIRTATAVRPEDRTDQIGSINDLLEVVQKQMGEVLKLRFGMDRQAARQRSTEMLATVGIPDPATRLTSYPHALRRRKNSA